MANVDRSNTANIIAQLTEIGLVEKLLHKPNYYQAIPLEEGIALLLNSKERQYNEIKREAETLLSQEIQNSGNNGTSFHQYQFKLLKRSKELQAKDIVTGCPKIEKNCDCILNKKRFFQGIIGFFQAQFNCLSRGVKFRIITEPTNSQAAQEKLGKFLLKPDFQIRYISHRPEVDLVILDRKIAKVYLTPGKGLGESYVLITDHPGCVKMFLDHFDYMWFELGEKAQKRELLKRYTITQA